jgi:hypothetical protein
MDGFGATIKTDQRNPLFCGLIMPSNQTIY